MSEFKNIWIGFNCKDNKIISYGRTYESANKKGMDYCEKNNTTFYLRKYKNITFED
jgi:hypothetical protein